MRLSRRASGFLLLVAAWTAFVWITLIKNVAEDHLPSHGTGFHVVHYVLAGIALVLDVGVISIGWRGWRGGGRRVQLESAATRRR
jgi:hypothetical protein